MTDPLIGTVLADRYHILQPIGEGGMGRVYLAEHVRMGRKRAAKVMSAMVSASADAISRFNREAANASRINHPNVAQIYDFGETSDGMLYLAMEYIEGPTLTTVVEHEAPLPIDRVGRIVKQVADALHAAHHLEIVHRDLKPDNIMIGRNIDGTDWVKVVDFGIAKTVQQSGEGKSSQTVTTAGVSLGTPEYMSPEQLAGERLDPRTDIYSLGLVAFNMLTGDLPYPRVTSKETLVRRLTSHPRTLAEVRPDRDWPASLQAALDRALAPEVADRYASAQEFGKAFAAAASGVLDPARTVRMTPPVSRGAVAGVAPTRVAATPMPEPPRRVPTRKVDESEPAGRRLMPLVLGALGVAGFAAAATIVVLRGRNTPAAPPPAGPTSTVVVRESAPDAT